MSHAARLLNRRTVLALGATGAVGALIAPSPSSAAPAGPSAAPVSCGGSVTAQTEIRNVPTYYEPTVAPFTFSYNNTFYSRLETWLTFWDNNTPASWAPARIYSLGTYVERNDGCVSMHNFGRAFDFTRILSGSALTNVFDGRFYLYNGGSGAAYDLWRRRYWATAASLHYHFEDVLTYQYNSAHYDHLHVDNVDSVGGNSTFATNDYPQVQHVQSCLNYVWGYTNVAVTGIWNQATADAAANALARANVSGLLTTSQNNWRQFNRHTLRFGSGLQSY